MSKKTLTAKDIKDRVENKELSFSPSVLKEIHSHVVDLIFNSTESQLGIFVINNKMNRGLMIKCQQLISSKTDWEELCFYFMHKLLHHQYVIRHCFITGGKNRKLSAFLQPSTKLRAQIPVKQIFGNIFIDLSIHKNIPLELKILSNVFNGYNYQRPLEFEHLVDLLFLKGIKKKPLRP